MINIFLSPPACCKLYLIQNACPFLNPADFSHERDIRYPKNPKGLLIIYTYSPGFKVFMNFYKNY
jgi:hypothetical protein